MRISDWSSDVCPSDLLPGVEPIAPVLQFSNHRKASLVLVPRSRNNRPKRTRIPAAIAAGTSQIQVGRESCRDRMCQYGSSLVVAGLSQIQIKILSSRNWYTNSNRRYGTQIETQ